MHYLVRMIVEAENEQDAHDEAFTIADQLVESQEFDYFVEVGGRWDECWKPVKLSSKAGLEAVQSTMKDQKAEFIESMKKVRKMVSQYSDEQIFNEEFEKVEGEYLSRYYFSKASGYHGDACQLYATGYCEITSQRELNHYLEDSEKYWVVAVDCHN